MVKTCHVVVAGARGVGKTCILHQLAFYADRTRAEYEATFEDSYSLSMDGSECPKEVIVLHDTAGVSDEQSPMAMLRRSYLQGADAFMLVYSVTSSDSFNRMDLIKKQIDKHFASIKDKKEVPIVVLGTQADAAGEKRKVQSDFASMWAQRERVKLYEVTAKKRNTLLEPLVYLASKLFHPHKEKGFSISKKLKAERSAAAIMMDI